MTVSPETQWLPLTSAPTFLSQYRQLNQAVDLYAEERARLSSQNCTPYMGTLNNTIGNVIDLQLPSGESRAKVPKVFPPLTQAQAMFVRVFAPALDLKRDLVEVV